MSINDEEPVWFAMRATFGRELKTKAFLEKQQIKCFIPMRYAMVAHKEKGRIRKLVPAVSNMMFVYTTKERIQTMKSTIEYLQYITRPESGKNVPIVVPENQMQHFIAVCNTYNKKLIYLTPEEINVNEGVPVRIVGGTFDGVEGTFVKVKKKRKKHVAVLIVGVTAVMIGQFDDGYLQVME